MKIHTDKIAYTGTLNKMARAIPGVHLQKCNPAGSRTRAHAYVVTLASDGTPDQHGAARNRRINYGSAMDMDRFDRPHAASWADWGWFLAAVFDADPNAHCEYYASATDFHAKTRHAFHTSVTA